MADQRDDREWQRSCSACIRDDCALSSPFERAVTTYGLLSSSSIALRVTWAIRPIGLDASVSAGRIT